jgi:hypothetical protein
MTPPPPFTVVRTAAEMFEMWQGLMGGGGFSVPSLWLVFFDDESRMQPVIVPIDDIPAEPDRPLVRNLVSVVAGLIDGGSAASVAVLLSRPGPSAMTESDRCWARALTAELAGLTAGPLHLATHDRLQVFAPDDLIAA